MNSELEKGVVSKSIQETNAIAHCVAESLGYRGCVALCGDLGAGKTAFAKGLAQAMGVNAVVKSPSFNVCLTYQGTHGNFAHIDAYRLHSPDDYDALLIDEILPDPKLICVEWPQIVQDALPENTLFLEISILEDAQSRLIRKF